MIMSKFNRMNIQIRKEQESDYQIVEQLIERAFRSEEHSDHREQFLVARLRGCDAFIPELSLVAELNGGIVGYILMTKIEIVSDDRSFPSLGLAPVAILPPYQKQGIGSALILEAHKRAVELGFLSSVLLGHQDYYPKFGYRKAIDFGIEFPFDIPHEYCMAVELVPGGLDGVHGTVRYSAPFME